ncbi:MAG: hypothetical protein NC355_08510 [Blautia sp.]|nr:hypothetical protein [Blautia sp.]
MKKIKIFAIIDAVIMAGFMFLICITEYIHKQDTSIYAGLSPMTFASTIFLLGFLIAAAILVLLLCITVTAHFINKGNKKN